MADLKDIKVNTLNNKIQNASTANGCALVFYMFIGTLFISEIFQSATLFYFGLGLTICAFFVAGSESSNNKEIYILRSGLEGELKTNENEKRFFALAEETLWRQQMDQNPFLKPSFEINKQIEDLKKREKVVADEMQWYDLTDPQVLTEDQQRCNEKVKKLELDIQTLEKDIKGNNTELRLLEPSIGALFNPFNWFDKEQSERRQKRAKLLEATNQMEIQKGKIKKELQEIRTQLEDIASHLQRYETIDYPKQQQCLLAIKQNIETKVAELADITERKMRFDEVLEPVLRELRNLEVRKTSAEADLKKAQIFIENLASARTSYDRAMIHEQIEKKFGYGDPRKIKTERQREINRVVRDCEKAKRRIRDISVNLSRKIETIIIDGNNLCYEAGKFIGLAAIKAIIPSLVRIGKVVIVFDSKIRRLIKKKDSEIQNQLGDKVKVHVVATKRFADETILSLACNDFTYVLSNDRYGEFSENTALKEGRILRHEIVDGYVFVHDLFLRKRYNVEDEPQNVSGGLFLEKDQTRLKKVPSQIIRNNFAILGEASRNEGDACAQDELQDFINCGENKASINKQLNLPKPSSVKFSQSEEPRLTIEALEKEMTGDYQAIRNDTNLTGSFIGVTEEKRGEMGLPKCTECEYPIDVADKYCPECGKQIEKPTLFLCQKCGHTSDRHCKYCPLCGTPLGHLSTSAEPRKSVSNHLDSIKGQTYDELPPYDSNHQDESTIKSRPVFQDADKYEPINIDDFLLDRPSLEGKCVKIIGGEFFSYHPDHVSLWASGGNDVCIETANLPRFQRKKLLALDLGCKKKLDFFVIVETSSLMAIWCEGC